MEKAWKEIARLREAGGIHRSGKKLSDFTPVKILEHAAAEMIELASEPDNKIEMADIMGCLIHYCIVQGWSETEIEECLMQKLKDRVSE